MTSLQSLVLKISHQESKHGGFPVLSQLVYPESAKVKISVEASFEFSAKK